MATSFMSRDTKSSSRGHWWLVALGLLLVAASQPLFLLLANHLAVSESTITAANDLAAIMGAVFTAGGLVIALVSIFTMLNIDRVARDATAPLIEDIPKQIELRMQSYLKAYGMFLEAKGLAEREALLTQRQLAIVDGLVENAAALEPSISGLYSWIGYQYYCAAAESFLVRTAYDLVGKAFPNAASADELPAIASRAIHWLETALTRNDGRASEIYAQIAELNGMLGAPASRIGSLVTKANRVDRTLPSGTTSLAFLFASCTDESEVKDLASLLGVSAPLGSEQIIEAINAKRDLAPMRNAVMLLAIPKPFFANGKPFSPTCLVVLHQEGATKGRVSWIPRAQRGPVLQHDTYPATEYDDRFVVVAQPLAAIDEIVSAVLDRFIVIAEWSTTTDTFPERPAS
jgi:hypothetical protein